MKIILASTSPRRKKIFRQLGLPFQTRTSRFQENLTLKLQPVEIARRFSLGKAMDVARREKNALIIGAATVVALGQTILGKPYTPAEAKKMLKKISGQRIRVISGYSIVDTKTKQIITRTVTTAVWIKKLTRQEITVYVKTGEPLDKVGAFGIQGRGALLVRKISGDYYTVVGLPLYDLADTLESFGLNLRVD